MVGAVKTGADCCSNVRKEFVSSMSRLPCQAILLAYAPTSLPKNGPEADISWTRFNLPKTAKLELRACGRINDCFHKESDLWHLLGPQRASWRLMGSSDR